MAPVSRLGRQIQEVLGALEQVGGDSALADALDAELQRLGYVCLHRSDDAANYARGDERVDFADGGMVGRPVVPADPFAALDDLMFVVEALCPRWPERPVFPAMELRF